MIPSAGFVPAYLGLPPGELRARAERAVASLADCRVCPRDCRVDRLRDLRAACRTGRHAVVSSAFPHLGEEDCLRGTRGSGTIFFSHCNLRCVFCQNFDISQGAPPDPAAPGNPPEEIAAVMLWLQRRGCHNVNLVTPEHVVPQVLEALVLASEAGLDLPLVYNTSAYDSPGSLASLDGVVDVYMPDFKLWTPGASERYLRAADYPGAARAALLEMHRQVGFLDFDEEGIARRGVLVRHLVMPGMLEETRAVLEWIAREMGPSTFVNLMDQYRPAGLVDGHHFPEIHRPLDPDEYREAWRIARDLGLRLDVRAG